MIIAEDTESKVLPLSVIEQLRKINIFFTENIRTARRHIKKIVKEKNIDNTLFYSFGKNNSLKLEHDFLPHILNGKNIGLISDAGMPCIADPGAKIVEYAHNFQIETVPLSGPNSITLGLMASGFNGQNFVFHGYLPIQNKDCEKKIKKIETIAKKNNQTQIFIETPYRNNKLFEKILKICHSETKLCLATNLTAKNQNIKTKLIYEWRKENINLHKQPTIFLIL